MLTKLSISNYALIDQLSVDFHRNLNTVTGETGAGKSIILGALGLILGNRAELTILKDKKQILVLAMTESNSFAAASEIKAYCNQNKIDSVLYNIDNE